MNQSRDTGAGGRSAEAGVTSRDSRLYRWTRPLLGHSGARAIALSGYLARLGVAGLAKNLIGSVDITHRCNMQCAHCYFTHQGYRGELSDAGWLAFFDRLATEGFPFYQCSWVGGEPLLRWKLVERLRGLFAANMVVTNGTIELPEWPDVNFYVSVDGTKEMYVQQRGPAGTYERVRANVLGHGHLKVRVVMVVTRQNHTCIERFLETWEEAPIRSVLFEFFTPVSDRGEDAWPGWELRDAILRRLLRLKDRYGDFIENNERTLRLMRSDRAGSLTRRCGYSRTAFSYGPDGKEKRPCMMGPGADCGRCGCILPFHVGMVQDKGLLFREIAGEIGKAVSGRGRRTR